MLERMDRTERKAGWIEEGGEGEKGEGEKEGGMERIGGRSRAVALLSTLAEPTEPSLPAEP